MNRRDPLSSTRLRRQLSAVAGIFLGLALLVGGLEQWERQAAPGRAYEPPPPGMVLIPAGPFWLGSDDPLADADERPRRQIYVAAFYLDQFEVTNQEFQRFKPGHRFPPGEENLPVTRVLKTEAEAYARWLGKRLPTGAEWEKAARGTDGRLFPWGNTFETNRANVDATKTYGPASQSFCLPGARTGKTGKLPPGTFPAGVSPYGVHDLAGNVWEWVTDVEFNRSPLLWGTCGTPRGIIRGGAHGYGPYQARASYQAFEGLNTTCNDVGFRCARSAQPRR